MPFYPFSPNLQLPEWKTPEYKNTITTTNYLTNYHVEEWIEHSWHPFKSFDELQPAQSCMDHYQAQFGGKFRIVSVIEEID